MRKKRVIFINPGDKLQCIKPVGGLVKNAVYTFVEVKALKTLGYLLAEIPGRTYKIDRFIRIKGDAK